MAKLLKTKIMDIDGRKYEITPPPKGRSWNHAKVRMAVKGEVRNHGKPFWRTVPMGSPRHVDVIWRRLGGLH